MDKQRSTKNTYKTKDRVTRRPLKTGGELWWTGSLSSSLAIVLSVILQYTDSDYPYGIFKLFFKYNFTCVDSIYN
jgi:hypothetical protein